MKNSGMGDWVAAEMDHLVDSEKFQKEIFVKQASDDSEDCKCKEKCHCKDKEGKCPCKKCRKDCEGCESNKKEATLQEVSQLLLQASDLFDQHGLDKIAEQTILALKYALGETMEDKDEEKEDCNEIRVEEIFNPKEEKADGMIEVPTAFEPFSMEDSMAELEADPDYAKFKEIIEGRRAGDSKRLEDLSQSQLWDWSVGEQSKELQDRIDNDTLVFDASEFPGLLDEKSDVNDAKTLEKLKLKDLDQDPELEGAYSNKLKEVEKELVEALEALQGEDFEDFELFTEPELRLSFQDTVPAELETMPAPPRQEDLELLTASQDAWWLKSAAKTEEDEDEEEEDFEDEE